MDKRKQAFQKRKAILEARDARLKQLVNENDLEGFKDFLKENYGTLCVKHFDYLFKNGSKELISIGIACARIDLYNYPERFYPKLFQYCDRNVMARYLNDVYKDENKYLPQCEKILIKRGELNLFSFYIATNELSKEAFRFLLKRGTLDIIENYLAHTLISETHLPIFLTYGKIEDIKWYFLSRPYIKYQLVANALKEVPIKRQEKIDKLRLRYHLD